MNELVGILTRLNALEVKFWKSNQKVVMDGKIWRTWKSNRKIVMNEERVRNNVMNAKLVQNDVMNEKFVKNSVMNTQIDPKVVMDLFSNQKLMAEFTDVNEPWLLIGIPTEIHSL